MSEFVKVGERILAKPSGCDYDLLPNKTYSLMFEDWTRTSYSANFRNNSQGKSGG